MDNLAYGFKTVLKKMMEIIDDRENFILKQEAYHQSENLTEEYKKEQARSQIPLQNF